MPKASMKKLHSRFIVVPADKASGNFVVICKKFYLKTMCEEMGIKKKENGRWELTGNAVYKRVTDSTEEEVIRRHHDMSVGFGLGWKEENERLPILFAIPKLHKNPYGFRFIAGASKASLKPPSVLLGRVLTFLKSHFERYCAAIQGNQGYNANWAVDNQLQVLDMLSSVKEIRSMVSADFGTLYTKLPLETVADTLLFLMNILFKHSGKSYIIVGFKNVYYSNEAVPNSISLRFEEVKELLSLVLNNTFVTFAGELFQQISGIPMGGNASAQLASLTLSGMEFRYLQKRENLENRRKLRHVVRYVDDLFGVNCGTNRGEFFDMCRAIYPSCLPLSDTTVSDSKCNYLDLGISIDNGNLDIMVYNKTNDFNFTVVRYVDASGNVPRELGLRVYYSQCIRIARICNHRSAFQEAIGQLSREFILKGYYKSELLDQFLCLFRNYSVLLSRFIIHTKKHAISCFNCGYTGM